MTVDEPPPVAAYRLHPKWYLPMPLKLKPIGQQVLLITGASSGIGLATARLAASRGAKVMLVARNEGSLADAVSHILGEGGEAAYAVADVGDIHALRAAAAEAVARFGRIDSWVGNAGVAIYAKLVETPLDEHEKMFRTNYFGNVHGAIVAHEVMRERGGAFIVVGSISSDLPSPILGGYAASKHAVKGFVDSLRMEFAADEVPISVTLIKPSGIDTPVAQHAANHVDGEAKIPPPVYDPVLVAEAIVDAAQTVRRDVTVGGVGRLQVLLGTHFPAALDAMSGVLASWLSDPKKPKTEADSVLAAEQPGRERSGVQAGRRVSLYAVAQRHPLATGASLLVGLAAIGGIVARRGRPAGEDRRRSVRRVR